jgi:hypothetical protein
MRTIVFRGLFSLLFVGVVDAADDWTQKSPAAKPSVRSEHGLAYIGGDQVLLFGGNDTACVSGG